MKAIALYISAVTSVQGNTLISLPWWRQAARKSSSHQTVTSLPQAVTTAKFSRLVRIHLPLDRVKTNTDQLKQISESPCARWGHISAASFSVRSKRSPRAMLIPKSHYFNPAVNNGAEKFISENDRV